MSKLDGLQKKQPMQDKPGEAETQQDEITVAQGLPPHQVPEIHQENEGIDQHPYCKLQDWKEQKCIPDFGGHRSDVSHHDAASDLASLRLMYRPEEKATLCDK